MGRKVNDRTLLTIIVLFLIALAVTLCGFAIYAAITKDFGGAAKAILALVTTIIIGVAGIGKILAGKSKR